MEHLGAFNGLVLQPSRLRKSYCPIWVILPEEQPASRPRLSAPVALRPPARSLAGVPRASRSSEFEAALRSFLVRTLGRGLAYTRFPIVEFRLGVDNPPEALGQALWGLAFSTLVMVRKWVAAVGRIRGATRAGVNNLD